MSKLTKPFEVIYPLKMKTTRDLKNTTEHIGDLVITGTRYCDPNYSLLEIFDRYSVDIDFVKWNGTDIKPVLTVTDTIDEIEMFCIRECASMFEEERRATA